MLQVHPFLVFPNIFLESVLFRHCHAVHVPGWDPWPRTLRKGARGWGDKGGRSTEKEMAVPNTDVALSSHLIQKV